MKNLTHPSDGRSCTVDNNRSSRNVDGSGKPSIPAREQEASARSSGSSDEVCDRGERDRVWEEVEYLLDSLSRIKEQITNGSDWDPDEIDWLNERYTLCRQQATHYILCKNLSTLLPAVSFPGEKLTYLQVAERLVKGCKKWELEEAILQIGLNPHERTYHKVTQGVSVEEAEQILLTMLGDGNYVLAGNYPERLDVSANSSWYKSLKKQLKEKGWSWQSKRIGGQVTQVIQRPPNG